VQPLVEKFWFCSKCKEVGQYCVLECAESFKGTSEADDYVLIWFGLIAKLEKFMDTC